MPSGKSNGLDDKTVAQAKKLIKLYMKELARPEKLENTPINQIASALGTLIDKFGAQNDDDTIIVTHNVPRAKEDES